MSGSPINILLADDDTDDCSFFKEALDEVPLQTNLVTVHDGVALMHLLSTAKEYPDVVFLDLNMPRKSGYDCLKEIKQDKTLRQLTIIIYSTFYSRDVADKLKQDGANYFIRKPGEFSVLKKLIHHSLLLISERDEVPDTSKFLLMTE